MTKTFDIIPVEDYYVVVDKQKNPIIGETWINTTFSNEIGVIHDVYGNEFEVKTDKCISGWSSEKEEVFQIIATIGKRIEGLAFIELPESDCVLCEGSGYYGGGKSECPICNGRGKAAQSKGTYTEEQLLQFAKWYSGNVNDVHDCSDGDLYAVEGEEELLTKQQIFKRSSLKKVPVSVELEMELYNPDEEGYKAVHQHQRVKITNPETNTIIPKSVRYEKF